MVSKNCKALSVINLLRAFAVISLLVTCKTIPVIPASFMQEEKFVPLERGASVYLFANVIEARSILNLLPIEELKDERNSQLLDKTGMAVAALFPENSGKRFQLAAWGNYPSFGAGFAFTFDKNWKNRKSSSGNFWYSEAGRFSIALTSKQVFAAAALNEIPLEPRTAASSRAEIPEGFNAFREGSPLSSWLIDPDVTITRVFQNAGIPIQIPVQQLFINIFPLESGYEVVLRFQLDNAQHARGMAAMLNVARIFISEDSGLIFSALLFANAPIQNNNSLEIKTGILNDKEMLEVINMFFKI
ncbi:MAG: hypothetical protein FWC21_04030 [Treponema sp.]|nr:hypothetical protein [Treponema sp.]